VCPLGTTCCDTPAGCKQLDTDGLNCGACGRTCPPGFHCASAICHCGTNAHCDAGGGGTCTSTTGACNCGLATCSPGLRCQPGGICG
jgi:hypothetical protein